MVLNISHYTGMYSSDCLTNGTALGCVSMATGMYSSDCVTNRAALGCVSTATLHVDRTVTNRAVLECVSTATLPVHFRLSHQQNSSVILLPRCVYSSAFIINRTALHIQSRLARQKISSWMCFYIFAASTVRNIAPTEPLCDVFPLLSCV